MGLVYDRHSVMTKTMMMMAIKRRIMETANELWARHWAKYNGFIYFRLIPTLSGTYYYCHSKWEVSFLSPFF